MNFVEVQTEVLHFLDQPQPLGDSQSRPGEDSDNEVKEDLPGPNSSKKTPGS